MTLWRLITREIAHYKLTFALGLISIIAAVGVLVAELTLLDAHDLQTRRILAEKEQKTREEMRRMEDDYRIIMKNMGFNLLILPKGQRLDNFYSDGYASKFMPEEYVEKLSNSRIMTIRHLLPSLEQKILWPEQSNRTIILIGTRGEVPFLHRDPKEPILVAVPTGSIVLGYEIWNSLELKTGDTVRLLGADFQVSTCHSQRGSKDDITVWIDLKKAQQLLNRENEINAILALKCLCVGSDLVSIRKDISRILPGVQIIEFENKVVAREKARNRAKAAADSALAAEKKYRSTIRREKEAFASWLIPLIFVGSTALIGLIFLNNVRERKYEVGILRAIGLRSRQIVVIFLAKAFMMGLFGAFAGYVVLVTAPFLSCAASWIPAVIASQQDPAVILKEE